MSTEEIPDQMWELMQNRLGYTDEELALFRNDPRNAKVMTIAPKLMTHTIVFEVVKSCACNSQHHVGNRFFFSGDGNLLTKMGPSKICAFLLPNMCQMIYGIHELWYAGVDPNDLAFKRAGCFDVGVQCGGWGNVIIEAKVMERQEAAKLAAVVG
jgi:hypothetical protein